MTLPMLDVISLLIPEGIMIWLTWSIVSLLVATLVIAEVEDRKRSKEGDKE